MTKEKLTVGYDTSEYTTTTSTHIEKTLKSFDELYDLNFPKENWLGKGKIEHFFIKVIIKAFITQALQEQDRESRRDTSETCQKEIIRYIKEKSIKPYPDVWLVSDALLEDIPRFFSTMKQHNIDLKQDEN